MKVFITGATGYIGGNVATALRRAGHEVWGLVRTEAKARTIAAQEIHPVLGDMQRPETYLSSATECSVLIHAAADFKSDTFALDRKTVESLLSIAHRGPRLKTFIYTSGVWVHGDTMGKLIDETHLPTPPKLVAGRPATEQLVLGSRDVKGLVIRPGCVYGKQGGLTGMWFGGAYKEKSLKAIGAGDNRWAVVHVDDLAHAYVRLVESGLSGEIFNITDRSRSTVREMVGAVARATGYQGTIQFVPVAEALKWMGDFAECLALDQHVDARKAVSRLGWQPRHGGFVDEVETYFESWKAAQS